VVITIILNIRSGVFLFLVFELFYEKSTKTKSYLGRSFAVTISYLGVEVKKVVVVWIGNNRPDNLPERFFL
jgi:hypothetical protein